MSKMLIGDIEIPIISQIEPIAEAEVDEINPIGNIDNIVVEHEKGVQTLEISGFLNQLAHSNNISIEEQKSRIKELRTRSVEENGIQYKDYFGHLLIEEIDLTDNSDSVIVNEVSIQARYHPWPKYFPESEP